MSDLDEITPHTYAELISMRLVLEYEYKMHGHVEISQYKILSLYIVTKYTQTSKNVISDYTIVT